MNTMFRALKVYNYRLWVGGALVSNIGTWMQRVAQDWLVLTVLTHNSGTAVGITTGLQFLPIIFLGPYAGVLADRVNKRKLLLATQTAMAEFGTTREQLSSVAVAASRWGSLNPAAQRRDILTHEEIVASPKLSSPFHKLDCCLITDGAGAVVVTTAERARKLNTKAVQINASAEFSGHEGVMAMLRRWAEPEDFVGPVLLLASDAGAFVTASNIAVDGGWTATDGLARIE